MQMHFSEDSRVKMYPGVRDTLLACRVPIFDEVSVDDLLDSMSKRQMTQLFIGLLSFKIAAALLILLAPFIATCNVPGGSWRATIPLAALMFGSVLGSLTWGLAADEFGRKPVMVFGVLVASCGAAFMVQAVSVWPSSWLALALAYLVMGYGLGCHCVPYGIVVESLPSPNRARLLISAELGWGLGAVFGAALAGSVLDSHGLYALALCSVIAAIGFFVVSLASLPESPRWLLKKGRISAARVVLQRLTGNVISRAQSLTSPTTVSHPLRRSAPPTSPISVGSGTTIPFNFMGRSSDSGELLFAAGQRRRDRWWSHVLAYWQLYTSWFLYGFSYYGLVIFIKNIAREPLGCSFDLTEVVVNSSAEIIGLVPFIVMAGDEASAATIFSGSLVLGAWAVLMGSSSVPHLSRTVLLLIARGAISCAETVLWVITNQGLLLPLLFMCPCPRLCPLLTTTTTTTTIFSSPQRFPP
jgi:MFS family permease